MLRPPVFLTALLTCVVVSAAPLILVKDGKPQATIVVPDDSLECVTYAAAELQKHVEMVSGAELPILHESEHKQGPAIHLGACKATTAAGIDASQLSVNAFIIRLTEVGLFMIGDDSPGHVPSSQLQTHVGTLFAVYEFLEKELGIRWLWPGDLGTFVPPRKTIVVKSWDQTWEPRLLNAVIRAGLGKWNREKTKGFSSLETYRRFKRDEAAWLVRHRMAIPQSAGASHVPKSYRYWERFGNTKKHLEYFALLNTGKREPMRGNETGSRITWCVSQPKLWDQVVADWVDRGRAQNNDFVQAGENDCPGLCMCEACRAWDAPDPRFGTHPYWNGTIKRPLTLADRNLFWTAKWRPRSPSLSDRYARFWMKVLGRAKKVRPDARVAVFAYANTTEAAKEVKLHPDIWVRVVAPFAYPFTEEKLSSFEKNWQAWADSGVSLVHRPNYMLCGHNMPLYFADALDRNLHFVFKNGCRATDFDSLIGAFANQGPTLYTLARLHLRPEMTGAEVLDEYYNAFGPAKTEVRRYFEHWEQVSSFYKRGNIGADVHLVGAGGYASWILSAPAIFTPEAMVRGEALLKQAEAVAADDALAKRRLAFLRVGFDDARMTLGLLEAKDAYRAHPEDTGRFNAFVEKLRQLEVYRHAHEELGFCNLATISKFEGMQWDRQLLTMGGPDDVLALAWKFKFDQEQIGEKSGWQEADFDDSDWGIICTDACWENQEVGVAWTKKYGEEYNGLGWYRLKFDIPAKLQGGKVSMQFGAVDESCNVWVNGKHLLTRIFDSKKNPNSWREPFAVDITDVARFDKPNTVVVMVQDLTGAGGIWKRVSLASTLPSKPVRSASPKTAARDQPLFDGGFENGGKGMSWYFVKKSGTTFSKPEVVGTEMARTGTHVMRLLAPQDAGGWFAARLFGVTPGATYDLTFYLRGGEGFDNILSISAGDKRTVVRALLKDEWEEVVLGRLNLPQDATYVYLAIRGLAQGTLWIDDVSLTPVPNSK